MSLPKTMGGDEKRERMAIMEVCVGAQVALHIWEAMPPAVVRGALSPHSISSYVEHHRPPSALRFVTPTSFRWESLRVCIYLDNPLSSALTNSFQTYSYDINTIFAPAIGSSSVTASGVASPAAGQSSSLARNLSNPNFLASSLLSRVGYSQTPPTSNVAASSCVGAPRGSPPSGVRRSSVQGFEVQIVMEYCEMGCLRCVMSGRRLLRGAGGIIIFQLFPLTSFCLFAGGC